MKFAFHLLGNRIWEFSSSLPDVPKGLFYQGEVGPLCDGDRLGVYLLDDNDELPHWDGLVGKQYRSNICKHDSVYSLFYGDIRKINRNGCIPIVCDIMDESFWYYYTNLKVFGLFTFSVNSDLCDLNVFQSILGVMLGEADPVYYEELA